MRRTVQTEGLDLPLPALRELRTLAIFHNAFAGRLFTGEGSPEGVIAADRGALYLRTDGGTSTTLYVKTANAGLKTGWTAK
jgi:hypothetical protein